MMTRYAKPRSAVRSAVRSAGRAVTGATLIDPDAAAYIAAIEGDGVSVTSTQKNAINAFYVTGKDESWYSSLKRMYLPIWGQASANARCLVSGTSGTFNGTVTHAAGNVQSDGSTGYFDISRTAADLGLSSNNAYHGFLAIAAATIDPSVAMGTRTAASSVMNFSRSGTSLRTVFGDDTLLSATSTDLGIISANRTSATRAMFRRDLSGRTTLASDSNAANGALPAIDLNYMRMNRTDGSPVYSNAKFGAVFFGTYLSDEADKLLTLSLKVLWETCTGLTLP